MATRKLTREDIVAVMELRLLALKSKLADPRANIRRHAEFESREIQARLQELEQTSDYAHTSSSVSLVT